MSDFYVSNYPEDIARTLCKLAGRHKAKDECKDALYYLKSIAENRYNNEYFRTLYRVLEAIVDADICGDFENFEDEENEEKEVLDKWYNK